MQNKIKSAVDFTKKYLFCQTAGILAFFLIGAGLLSVWLEQEVISDFLMYHYYNGYAFLNDRLTVDIAPAKIATYYNPLLDVILYLLDNAFSKKPYLFIMGLPAGLALFIVYKIADLFFTDKKVIWISASLLISLTGFAFFRQIGTCTHEITLTCFILGAIYILLKTPKKSVWYFIAGALLGAAAGFKLTAALYCVSTGITLILFYKTLEKPKTFIGLFVLGGLAGFLAVDGFWMWTLWKNFQNPFFPFWNKIFKSPYFFDANYVDDLHLSYDWNKLLFLPFLIFYENTFDQHLSVSKQLVANIPFSDARWMIGFFLLIVFSVRLWSRSFRQSVSGTTFFVTVFMLLSYLIWLFSSQNIRFVIPVEMLFGPVFLKGLSSCPYPKNFFKEIMAGSAVLILFMILIMTPFFSERWGSYYRAFLPETALIPPKTLILTTGSHISYYAVKFLERTDGRIINSITPNVIMHYNFSDYNKFAELKKDTIKRNKDTVIFLIHINKKKIPSIKNNACYLFKIHPFNGNYDFYICSKPEIIQTMLINTSLEANTEKDGHHHTEK